MYNLRILAFVFFTLATACKPKTAVELDQGESIIEKPVLSQEELAGQDLLERCINAHGGMDRWNEFDALEYRLINNGTPIYQLTILKDRRAYLKSEDFEVGFDGELAWAFPDASQIPGKSPAFYYNLDFYFIGIPFVLKDPGVHVSYDGKVKIDNVDYESLKVTFGSGIGISSQDIYYLYIEPESHILRILVYSVSYFDATKAETFNSAKVYSGMSEVQGLLMPTKMENFAWEAGELGETKNHLRIFEDLKFLKEIPDQERFLAPEGAVVEKISN